MFSEELRYLNGISYYQVETPNYFVDYIPGDLNQLVITFENADKPDEPRPDGRRLPWGGEFLNKKGYCVLGVKPKKVDWYREACLHAFFRSQDFKAFVSSFSKVFFYGSSMGGFAALVFSDSVPGSIVIAFNPQTTLIPELTQWERRYPQGTKQSWDGDFNDAKQFALKAKTVYVAYDPFCKEDNLHIRRIAQDMDNMIELKMPFVGHIMLVWMRQSGILDDFLSGAFSESLTGYSCSVLARSRRNISRYYHVFGSMVRSENAAFQCINKFIECSDVPENFSNIVGDLVGRVNDKSIFDIGSIPVKSSELMSRRDVSKGYFFIAKRASDLGLVEESLGFSLKVFRCGAYCPFILLNISECMFKLGRYDSARLYAIEAISADGDVANAYRIKSRIEMALGLFDSAYLSALESIELEPTSKLGQIDCLKAAVASNRGDASKVIAERLAVEFNDDSYLVSL